MPFAIRYKVPYELAIQARDIGSGKNVTNILYFRCATQLVAPPAYGAPIAGPSSTATLLANIATGWAGIFALLNANYATVQYVMRAMLGKRYGTPLLPIAALISGAPVSVQTAAPHGFVTGDTVSISGVTAPGTANDNWVVTVASPVLFHLDGSNIAGVWSGNGSVQKVQGSLQIQYTDQETLVGAGVGGVAGDALPLFATASVRRLNGGVGRAFRSRMSLSPMSEADSLDGGFIPAKRTAMAAALAAFTTSFNNAGTDAGSGLSYQHAFARSIAMAQASPWTTADPFMGFITSMAMQRNTGSLVRRKPRLTITIT